jgi:RNA polymerase subunit RPABC4/transcription elongation factor Spt4
MRYCYNCNHVTTGEPLFCNFCGRSYNVKLCPRQHPNPRSAKICSRCGSRDLSTPQPRVPIGTRILLFLLSLVPALGLTVVTIVILALFVRELFAKPQIFVFLVFFAVAIGVLAGVWMEVPLWFRKLVYRCLWHKRSKREEQQ